MLFVGQPLRLPCFPAGRPGACPTTRRNAKTHCSHNRERTCAVGDPYGDRTALTSRAPAFARHLRRGRRAREDAEIHLPDASRSHNRSSGKLSEMRDETRADKREETPNVQRPTLNVEGSGRLTSNRPQPSSTITRLRSPRRPTARQASMSTKKCRWKCTPPSISLIR